MELSDRIRAYVSRMPPAVSGQNGHNATLTVACVLIHGWDLSIDEALPFLEEYNRRCDPPWNHKELMHKLRSAVGKPSDKGKGYLLQGKPREEIAKPSGPAPAPKAERKRAEWAEVDSAAVDRFTAGMPSIDIAWFRRRSPVDVSSVSSGGFLDAIFAEGERVIIFTRYYSQGDFIWWRGRGGFRLSDERETKAVPSELPKTGRIGVWYLVQPISGQWEIGDRAKDGVVKYTRRSEVNVTRWAHFVLESDEPGSEEWWPKVIAALRLPIVAIYSSGGRSIHALVKYEVPSKADWDQVKHQLERVVCPLGADPMALSAVRLSRLPSCMREGKEIELRDTDGNKTGRKRYERYPRPRLQELIYLNPGAEWQPIVSMQEVRS